MRPSGWGDDADVRLVDLWRVLSARRWTILAILLTVVSVAMIWTLKQVPIFSATSRLQIESEDPRVSLFRDIYPVEVSTNEALQTQFQILESRTLVRRVVNEMEAEEIDRLLLGDPGLPERIALAACRMFRAAEGPEVCARNTPNRIVDEYLDHLTVTPVPGARLVDVSFESPDPEFAARVINLHARYFIDQNLRYRSEATELAADFLSENLATLKINLEKSEDQLQEYSRSHQIIFSEDGQSTALEKLQQLEAEFTAAQADRFRKEAYARIVAGGGSQAIAQVAEDALITALSVQLSEFRSQESELAVTLGPEYPDRQRLRSRIAETERLLGAEIDRVLGTVQAEHRAAAEREALLAGAVEAQRNLVNTINQEIIQYNILKREVDANRNLYEGLLNRLGEANVSSTLEASNIRIIDRAAVPEEPVKPRKALTFVLSVFVGLVSGVGFALIRDQFDDSIGSPDDVVQHLGMSTLGIIPKANRLSGDYAYSGAYGQIPARTVDTVSTLHTEHWLEFVSYSQPASALAEAYRSVRTSLLLSFPEKPARTCLVTSPSPSEGKTVTAINIAISLAHTGARTLLVNADMRNPRVDSLFSFEAGDGLASVLAGAAPLEAAIRESGIPNLYVLPCGPIPPNPGELLTSHRLRKMIVDVRESFDHVIFDSPPLGNVSDARILAHLVDCTMLIVRASSTSRHLTQHVLRQLGDSGARMAGVILNDFDARESGHAYAAYGYYAAYPERRRYGPRG